MKILYIDDRSEMLALLGRYLKSWGYEAIGSSSGEGGWKLINEQNPDIVIIDWVMPDLEGPDLCKRVRAAALPGYTYLIMLTARKNDVVEGMEAGADDFIGKPFNKAELKVRIKAAERIIKLERELENSNRILTEKNRMLEESEEQLRRMAHYDKLTGLPNRVLFFDRIERALLESIRYRRNFGLLFIDLDGFKAVNDTFGHDTGDGLLCAVADRMQECVRNSDTVARMGGDEFCVIIRDILQFTDCNHVAEKIISALTQPFTILDNVCHISASIGISFFPDDGKTAEEMISHADTAMYIAKKSGKGVCKRWQP